MWPPRSSSMYAMLSSAAMETGMAGGGGGVGMAMTFREVEDAGG